MCKDVSTRCLPIYVIRKIRNIYGDGMGTYFSLGVIVMGMYILRSRSHTLSSFQKDISFSVFSSVFFALVHSHQKSFLGKDSVKTKTSFLDKLW